MRLYLSMISSGVFSKSEKYPLRPIAIKNTVSVIVEYVNNLVILLLVGDFVSLTTSKNTV
jgi:hypothetical protein